MAAFHAGRTRRHDSRANGKLFTVGRVPSRETPTRADESRRTTSRSAKTLVLGGRACREKPQPKRTAVC